MASMNYMDLIIPLVCMCAYVCQNITVGVGIWCSGWDVVAWDTHIMYQSSWV